MTLYFSSNHSFLPSILSCPNFLAFKVIINIIFILFFNLLAFRQCCSTMKLTTSSKLLKLVIKPFFVVPTWKRRSNLSSSTLSIAYKKNFDFFTSKRYFSNNKKIPNFFSNFLNSLFGLIYLFDYYSIQSKKSLLNILLISSTKYSSLNLFLNLNYVFTWMLPCSYLTFSLIFKIIIRWKISIIMSSKT